LRLIGNKVKSLGKFGSGYFSEVPSIEFDGFSSVRESLLKSGISIGEVSN